MRNLLVLFFLSLNALFLFGCAKPVVQPTPAAEPQPVVDELAPVDADLQTYTNNKYGFEFQYPIENSPGNKFQIIEAENNPDTVWRPTSTVVLLWCDFCQSYEMIVQVWDSQAQFQKECNGYCSPQVTYQAWNKYISIINNNQSEIVSSIISTFKILN